MVPDLIVVDSKAMADLASKRLLVPLDELLPEELIDDLYPVAIKGGTVEGRLMAVPFEASIEHAIYNTSKIALSPLTWDGVFASGATYIFPTAGQDGLVNDSFLIQYLSTGSELVDEEGKPALNVQALTDVLSFYQTGIESGAILTDVLDYATVENCWPKYLQAEVVMSNISSKLYLAGRGLLTVSRATAIPTRDGQAVAFSEGYAWAITTLDPERQPLAAELMEWLLYPGNMAAWSQAAGTLPTRRAAFQEMDRDPYAVFLLTQMEYVIPYPTSETHQRIYRAMQQAVDAVLRQGVLAEVAAENVLIAVNQETSP